MKVEKVPGQALGKSVEPSGLSFRRGRITTALSVNTINVSKGDQCSCTGQPGQCE